MMDRPVSSHTERDRPFLEERRFMLRRVTVRRRRERAGDRRVSERRRPGSRLGAGPEWALPPAAPI